MNDKERRLEMRRLIFGEMQDMMYHNARMKRVDNRSDADFIIDTVEQAEEILTCQNWKNLG